MNVIFFAQSRDAAGCAHYLLKIEKPITAAEFWIALVEARPELAPHAKSARLARNETYLHPGDMIQPDDEIAVIPPVSGG